MGTKDIILRKTFELLLEKGYNGVSVSDIRESTGMARGLLYHYYQNQEELFEDAISVFFRDWLQWDREEYKECAVPGMIAFLSGKYHRIAAALQDNFVGKIALTDVFMLFSEAARHRELAGKLWQEAGVQRFGRWKLAFLNSFSRGELCPGVNLESVARQFAYLEEGILGHRFVPFHETEVIYELEKELNGLFELVRR